MTTFYICRHGETENNKRGLLMGWIDTPLTDEGKKNAQSSAEKLKGIHIDKIISSDLGRAFITAYIISRQLGYTSDIELCKDLREMSYGDLAQQPYSVYPTLTPEENENFTPPHGESLLHMQRRVINCINALGPTYDGKVVLLVAHDGTINALRAHFNHMSIGQADSEHNPHDFVAKLIWDEGTITSFDAVAVA